MCPDTFDPGHITDTEVRKRLLGMPSRPAVLQGRAVLPEFSPRVPRCRARRTCVRALCPGTNSLSPGERKPRRLHGSFPNDDSAGKPLWGSLSYACSAIQGLELVGRISDPASATNSAEPDEWRTLFGPPPCVERLGRYGDSLLCASIGRRAAAFPEDRSCHHSVRFEVDAVGVDEVLGGNRIGGPTIPLDTRQCIPAKVRQ